MVECVFVDSYMNEKFTLMHGMEHIKYVTVNLHGNVFLHTYRA
jgi:hypothetical protein